MAGPLPQPGELVAGRFRLEAEIAEGGMGKVYSAVDGSGRKVAIKLLTVVSKDAAARFERELQVSRKVKHPRCVDVLGHGKLPAGPFMVMEWLEGRSLWEVVRDEGPLEPARAARLCADLAEALEAAHEAGIVHRDVKPENVMVSGSGPAERAKLVDFGIARFADEQAARVTQLGVVVGSVEYMSPEQLRGEDATSRSDLYAAGGVLYFLLEGKAPYGTGAPAELAQKHLGAQVPRLTRGTQLQGVLERAMAKDPGQRFKSAAELRTALRRVFPSEIRALSSNRAWKVLALAAAVLAIAAGAYLVLESREAPAEAPAKEQPAKRRR